MLGGERSRHRKLAVMRFLLEVAKVRGTTFETGKHRIFSMASSAEPHTGPPPQGCAGCAWGEETGTCYKPMNEADQEHKDDGDKKDMSAENLLKIVIIPALAVIDRVGLVAIASLLF